MANRPPKRTFRETWKITLYTGATCAALLAASYALYLVGFGTGPLELFGVLSAVAMLCALCVDAYAIIDERRFNRLVAKIERDGGTGLTVFLRTILGNRG